VRPRKATRAFPRVFAAMQEILHRHDPGGLFWIGAPKDEHDESIRRIICRLQRVDAPNEVPSVLEAVLVGWVTENGDDPTEVCGAMAPEIWAAWCAFQNEAG
jgi:hypothetical protein